MEKFSSNEVQLNVGPYAMNSNILRMPSKGNTINNLYDVKDDNLVANMKNELNVRGEQKWGAEGYKEETKKMPERTNYVNTQGISSSNLYNDSTNSNSYGGISVGEILDMVHQILIIIIAGGKKMKN